MSYKVLNNAFSTLATSLSDVATSLTVLTGHGDRFPVISSPDFTYVTLEDASGNIEIVKVTARATTSDALTIARGQDGTVARNWAAGDIVELRIIAALLATAIAHVDDLTSAHLASAIGLTPTGNLSTGAVNVQAAITELDNDLTTLGTSLTSGINNLSNVVTSHLTDTTDAHDASAISYTPTVGVVSDNLQAAVAELGIRESLAYVVTTGTASALLAAPAVPITEYKDGQTFNFKFHVEPDTNATAKISGLVPPLDLKIQNAYGDFVNIFKGDVTLGSYPFCKVILGGTALLVESSIDVNTRVGHIYDQTAVDPDPNTFELPLAPTNISRVAYPRLLNRLIKSSIVTISIASPGVVSWNNHGLANGSPIYLTTTGALPTGHAVNTVRYAVNATTNNFQLSLTKGGAAIVTTGTQSGIHIASYAPHGNGNGTTTFGCPYLKQDHTEVRGTAGNLGEETVGQNLAFTIPIQVQAATDNHTNVNAVSASFNGTSSGSYSNGGSANLAAGMRVMKLIVYQ